MFCSLVWEELWRKIQQNLDEFGLMLYAVYENNAHLDKGNTG